MVCAIIATSLAADVGVRAWFSPGDPPGSGPLSPPSRQAGRNVTAGLFFCQPDHPHGRAPWPGPRRDLAGRAEAPHARGARAGPSAGGYGSASLFSSPRPATHFVGEGWPAPPSGNRPSGPFTGSPVVLEDRSAGDDMSRRLRWASPEGACRGGIFCGGPADTKVLDRGPARC